MSEKQFPLGGRVSRVHEQRPQPQVRRESTAETAFQHPPLSLSAPRQRYVSDVREPAMPVACISGGSNTDWNQQGMEQTVGIEKSGIPCCNSVQFGDTPTFRKNM